MQISFDRLFAKNLQFFFGKLVQFVSLCQRLSKKLNFIKIWQVEVGQNKDLVCYRKIDPLPAGIGLKFIHSTALFRPPSNPAYVKINYKKSKEVRAFYCKQFSTIKPSNSERESWIIYKKNFNHWRRYCSEYDGMIYHEDTWSGWRMSNEYSMKKGWRKRMSMGEGWRMK